MAIEMVKANGFEFPSYIVPQSEDLATSAKVIGALNFGLTTLLKMKASVAAIKEYFMYYFSYSDKSAQDQIDHNYPVLNQTPSFYKSIAKLTITHMGNVTEEIPNVIAVKVDFKDGSAEIIG